MNKIIEYIKIIGLMGIALFISLFMVNDVFYVNSPQVRPNFLARILTKTQVTLARLNPLRTSPQLKAGEKPSDVLKEVKPVFMMKGVYAKTAPNMTATEYTVGEVEWVEYSVTLKSKPDENGVDDGQERVIKVRVPKGQTPPTSDVLQYSQ